MSDKVIAISSEVVECGKRVSDSSKKKFVWRFRIGSTSYDLQLISSALSGKRAVILNDQPIYSQQNVLNINFDFNHNIDGHSLRISKESEGMHNYSLRIDNRGFDYLLKKKDNPVTEPKVTGKYEATSSDPFSEFQKLATTNKNTTSDNNFGDFDEFDWSKQDKKSSQTDKKVQQQPKDQFDFDFTDKNKSSMNIENFETNNMNSFQKNFNNFDNLINSDNFTTNNYGQYNNYLDLISGNEDKSDKWGVPVDPKQKTILQKIKPDITGKQIINKTLMTAVEIKKKAVNQFQSLI